MEIRPASPLRLGTLLLLGGIAPLAVLGLLVLIAAALARAAFQAPDSEMLLYPAGLAAACAGVVGWWLFRVRPLPEAEPTPVGEVPALAELLSQVEAGVQGAHVRRIWIHRGFQVNLQTRPVFGPLGWASHGWALGAFSLMHFTPRELEAALLWDQAYWSRQNGWLNLEAKRILQFWVDVAQALRTWRRGTEPNLGLAILAKPVLAWADGLERLGAPFRFDQVLMADRSVSLAMGALTTAQMLTKEALTEFQVDALWYRAWSETLKAVPASPLAEAQAALKGWPDSEVTARLEALQEGWVSTVGAFRFRMEALGVIPEVPRPPVRSAWEHYLLEDAPELVEAMEAEWREDLAGKLDTWAQAAERAGARYREWAARDAVDPLPEDYLPEMADLAVAHGTEAEACAWLERWTTAQPGSANAKVAWARFLLPRDPEGGRAALEALKAMHPFNRGIVARLEADEVARTRPGTEEAVRARVAAYEAGQQVTWAEAEREKVSLVEDLAPHEAPEAFLANLRSWLSGVQGLARAYVVRKPVHHLPESPVFLVVLVRKGFLRSVLGSQELGHWQGQLVRTLPAWPQGKVFLLVLRGRQRFREGRLRLLGPPVFPG